MSGGGETQSGEQTTATVAPWEGQQPYLQQIFSTASDLFGQGAPESYPGQTVANRDDATTQAENYLQGYASNVLPGQIDSAQAAHQGYFNPNFLTPEANPNIQGFVEASIRPVTEQYQEQVLPSIQTAAQQNGAYGGIRQNLVTQQAGQDYLNTIGDISQRTYFDAYNRNLGAQLQALGMAPQMAQLGTVPASLNAMVGQARQQYDQSLIDSAMQQWQMENQRPWDHLGRYLNLIQGNYGSNQTRTGPPTQTGGFPGFLGGAATGAGLANTLGLGSQWPLALLGGIAGWGG